MRLQKNQKGLTFISWLIILAIGGFFVLLALKLTPIYLENQGVKSVVQSLNNDPLIRKTDSRGIRNIIKKRMKINSIYDFPKDAIKIKKTKTRLNVDITYNKEEKIVANVYVLVKFSEQLSVDIVR
ncbi:MAG: DUF4845 domain-containing protein [Gammaproteobacteria bacterium]|nr:DUF4845 domain-containing protein [Gammaproteobacteria bacterium]NNJ91772.1 DUF4845 domain-containing protein [Gammaproteobacteria bacterium]